LGWFLCGGRADTEELGDVMVRVGRTRLEGKENVVVIGGQGLDFPADLHAP